MSDQAIGVIEEAIRGFGLDPDENRVEGLDKWKLSRGSADINVRLFNYDEGKLGLEVCAYMVTIPENPDVRFRLFNTVLTLNDSLVGCWFSIRDDTIYLISNRNVEGMDPAELAEIINDLSYYADLYDDRMANDFAD